MNVNFEPMNIEKNVIKLFNYIKYFNIDQNLFEKLSNEVSFMLSDHGYIEEQKNYSILDKKSNLNKTLILLV